MTDEQFGMATPRSRKIGETRGTHELPDHAAAGRILITIACQNRQDAGAPRNWVPQVSPILRDLGAAATSIMFPAPVRLTVTQPNPIKNLQKQITVCGNSEKRPAPVTTES